MTAICPVCSHRTPVVWAGRLAVHGVPRCAGSDRGGGEVSRDYGALRRSDERDAQLMAYAIRGPLHHCTGIPACLGTDLCAMCRNAARLAVQHYRPVIEKRTVRTFVDHFGAGCDMPHPGGD